MLLLYFIIIAILIAAWYGIAECSWKEFFAGLFLFGAIAIIFGGMLTLLGSCISTEECESAPVSEVVYEVESLNEVFGDSYKENDYILFKDNQLFAYVKDIDSGIIIEKKLASNVQVCYSDISAGAHLSEYEDDYASPILRHLFWEQYPARHIIEIPSGSTIIPYGDMFVKEAN